MRGVKSFCYTEKMKIKLLSAGENKIAEIIAREVIIKNIQDSLDLMANVDARFIILHDYNFESNFFDLSTRKLGEALQKFSNYQVKLAIIGDFEKYPSKTLKDFIYESNKLKDHLFVSSKDEAAKIWRT